MPELFHGSSAFVIAQMPVALAYSHFQFVRIRSTHQHVHVIVGLYDHGICLGSIGESLLGHPAQISHYHELMVIGKNMVPDSLGRIVRDFEVFDAESGHIVPFPFGQNPDAAAEPRLPEFAGGQG